ncbi:MAG: hypothetical protein ACKPKO_44495, partial [Candidatus Fonsibacter sp.]
SLFSLISYLLSSSVSPGGAISVDVGVPGFNGSAKTLIQDPTLFGLQVVIKAFPGKFSSLDGAALGTADLASAEVTGGPLSDEGGTRSAATQGLIQDPPTSIESFDPGTKLVSDPPLCGGACASDLGALGATCDDDMPKLLSLMPSDENFVPWDSDRAKSGILCVGTGSVVGQAEYQSLSKDPGPSAG